MNLLISEDVKSLTDLLLSLFFDQIRLFFFYLKSSPHPLWCFEEWNEVLLLLPQLDEAIRPYLNPWKASDPLESQLSVICGVAFLILSRIHGEREKSEQWMGLLHQFEKEVLIQQHAKNEGVVLDAIDAVLRAMDGCILSLTKQTTIESSEWVLIEGIRFPRSLLDLIFLLLSMHSNQHPSISAHFAQYLYSPFAQSNATLPFILDALFAFSLSEIPNLIDYSSIICWENEWIQPFRSLSLIDFMSLLIDRINNSFSSPIIVLNSHVTEDVWCDEIGDEWMGHFASTPKDEVDSTSFTLSPQKSLSQAPSVLFYSNSKSLLSLITSLYSFSEFRVIQSIISSIEDHSILPASFTQYCVFLAILAGIVEETPIEASESDVLELISSLAEIRSLPSCIVYPFIASFYSSPFDSLQLITQFLLIRCFPLALKSPRWSKNPLILQIRRYVQFLFGELPSPECPSQFRDLTLNVVVEWFEVLARRNRIEKSGVERMYQRMKPNESLCRDFVDYALTHFSAIEDAMQPFYLAFFEQFVKDQMQKAREVFFGGHVCNRAANLLLILCSLDLSTLRGLLDAPSATRFMEAVLCQEGNCPSKHAEPVCCRCLQCIGEVQPAPNSQSTQDSQSTRHSSAPEHSSAPGHADRSSSPGEASDASDLKAIRALILQLHSKLIQILRLLFPDKASRSHRYFPLLRSCFPSLSSVCNKHTKPPPISPSPPRSRAAPRRSSTRHVASSLSHIPQLARIDEAPQGRALLLLHLHLPSQVVDPRSAAHHHLAVQIHLPPQALDALSHRAEALQRRVARLPLLRTRRLLHFARPQLQQHRVRRIHGFHGFHDRNGVRLPLTPLSPRGRLLETVVPSRGNGDGAGEGKRTRRFHFPHFQKFPRTRLVVRSALRVVREPRGEGFPRGGESLREKALFFGVVAVGSAWNSIEHRYSDSSERFSAADSDLPRFGGKDVEMRGLSFRSFPANLPSFPRFPDWVRRSETLGGGGGLGIQDCEDTCRSFRGEFPLETAIRGDGKFQ